MNPVIKYRDIVFGITLAILIISTEKKDHLDEDYQNHAA